jgi:hypothetical protein
MDESRKDFLPGPALSLKQDRYIRIRCLFHFVSDRPHGWGTAKDHLFRWQFRNCCKHRWIRGHNASHGHVPKRQVLSDDL